jgi:hypothetical protein
MNQKVIKIEGDTVMAYNITAVIPEGRNARTVGGLLIRTMGPFSIGRGYRGKRLLKLCIYSLRDIQ